MAPSPIDRTILKEGLPLWLKLRDLDGENAGTGKRTLGDWDAMKQAEAISEALTLEPTEVTAQMMLGHYLKIYEADTGFSMEELLFHPAEFEEKARLCRQLHAILERDDLVQDRQAFVAQLEQALVHYGAADREDIQDLLGDDSAMAILRRDAFRSNRQLALSQFLQGDAGTFTQRPAYSTVLRQWWNVNALLEAALRFPDGVSLHLINAPSGYESFFVFLVKRGANLYLLHDAPDYEHPLQGEMCRRPDRALDRRASKNWFPYDLMGLDYDEATGEAYIRQVNETGLVPTSGPFVGQTTVVKHINEMGAQELIWVTLMFDLLMDRFWVQELPSLPMSYTGQMLRQEDSLRVSAQAAGLPVVLHEKPTVAVPTLTLAAVAGMADAPEAEAWLGETPEHPFAWMEARYGKASEVPDDTFNLVLLQGKQTTVALLEGEVKVEEHQAVQPWWEKKKQANLRVPLKTMSPTHFGTAEELKADRAFLARKNYAEAIQAAANREYDARKDEILAWYRARMAERVPFLKGLLGHGRLVVNDQLGEGLWPGFEHVHATVWTMAWDRAQGRHAGKGMSHELMSTFMEGEERYHFRHLAHHLGPFKRVGRYQEVQPLCFYDQTKPSAHVVFTPTNAAELAWLLGMEIAELPDVLQPFTQMRAGGGNHLLNRIDPLVWTLENPWTQMDFNVRLCLSKRGLKKAEADRVPVDLSPLDGVNARMGNVGTRTPALTDEEEA